MVLSGVLKAVSAIFVFVIVCKSYESGSAANKELVTRLEDRMPSSFPPLDMVNRTVKTELLLNQILGLNEKRGTLTVRFYVSNVYVSPSVSWNTTQFEGVDRLIVPSGLIWVPNFGESSWLHKMKTNLKKAIHFFGHLFSNYGSN